MMKQICFVLGIFFICSCKKENEFQSCSNFDQLLGEWNSINTDTKNTLTFKTDGEVIQHYGTERTLRLKSTSCTFEIMEDSINYKFRVRSEDGLRNYIVNKSFDTLLKASHGQDLSKDTSLFNQMRFIKIK